MPAHALSGSSMHASGSMFQLSRPDLAANGTRKPGQSAKRTAAKRRVVGTPEHATANPPELPLQAVSLPLEALRVHDPVLAEQHYRAGILREITDLMRAHAISVRDVSRALGRGGSVRA